MSCFGGRPGSLPEVRPYVTHEGVPRAVASATGHFPERELLQLADKPVPYASARLHAIFREVGSATPEPDWQSGLLGQEIESIKDALDRLKIGAGTLLRHRLGNSHPEETQRLRSAAMLYARWGIAMMRTGEINQRIWGAQKLDEALTFDPGNELITLAICCYQQVGGLWSNALQTLDDHVASYGTSDLIDLERMRLRLREWTIWRDSGALVKALDLARSTRARHGSPERCPDWLDLEQARLYFAADSIARAEEYARRAVGGIGTALGSSDTADSITAAQAELMLGIIEVRRLEYIKGARHLDRAAELASNTPDLTGLGSWLTIPWDLWTEEERRIYGRSLDRNAMLEEYWRVNDPIQATPFVSECRVEYLRRVGEAWFLLQGIHAFHPGPLTDAGRTILRYGLPMEWTPLSRELASVIPQGEEAAGWRLTYTLPSLQGWRKSTFRFREDGTGHPGATGVDAPGLEAFVFDHRFAGRGYRLDTAICRFREPDGSTRVTLVFDTYLPQYEVRFPMSGHRFDGEARVTTAIYRLLHDQVWTPGAQAEMVLDRETLIESRWNFRRRTGVHTWNHVNPGIVRFASLLELRDQRGRMTALAVDNGEDGNLGAFGWDDLEASDLQLMARVDFGPLSERELQLRPGLIAFGPDPEEFSHLPRAGRHLLSGEDLAFYLEVYNLRTEEGLTEAELMTSLERVREDGGLDYSVSLRGQANVLRRPQVSQWNIARTFGLGGLPVGRYRLTVAVVDRTDGRRVARSVPFRVVSEDDLVDLYGWKTIEPPASH